MSDANKTRILRASGHQATRTVHEQPTRLVKMRPVDFEGTALHAAAAAGERTALATVLHTLAEEEGEPQPGHTLAEFTPQADQSAPGERTVCYVEEAGTAPRTLLPRLLGALAHKRVRLALLLLCAIVCLGGAAVFLLGKRAGLAGPVQHAAAVVPLPGAAPQIRPTQRATPGAVSRRASEPRAVEPVPPAASQEQIPQAALSTRGLPAASGEPDGGPAMPNASELLRDAVDALADGRFEESRRLYLQLAREVPQNRSYPLAARILNRMEMGVTK